VSFLRTGVRIRMTTPAPMLVITKRVKKSACPPVGALAEVPRQLHLAPLELLGLGGDEPAGEVGDESSRG
jgi:hypothetical protein